MVVTWRGRVLDQNLLEQEEALAYDRLAPARALEFIQNELDLLLLDAVENHKGRIHLPLGDANREWAYAQELRQRLELLGFRCGILAPSGGDLSISITP